MAFYTLWILGVLITAGAAIAAWKTGQNLQKTWRFQREATKSRGFKLVSKNVIPVVGWLLAGMLMLSLASQSSVLEAEAATQPDRLCFFGSALFFLAKSLEAFYKDRVCLNDQGFIWTDEEYKYSQIRKIELHGTRADIVLKNGKDFLVSKGVGGVISEGLKQWTDRRRKAGKVK